MLFYVYLDDPFEFGINNIFFICLKIKQISSTLFNINDHQFLFFIRNTFISINILFIILIYLVLNTLGSIQMKNFYLNIFYS